MTQLLLVPTKGTVRVPDCTPAFMGKAADNTQLRNGQLIRWEILPAMTISTKGLNNIAKFLNTKNLHWPDEMTHREIFPDGIVELQRLIRDVFSDYTRFILMSDFNYKQLSLLLQLTSHCIAFECSLRITENPHDQI